MVMVSFTGTGNKYKHLLTNNLKQANNGDLLFFTKLNQDNHSIFSNPSF